MHEMQITWSSCLRVSIKEVTMAMTAMAGYGEKESGKRRDRSEDRNEDDLRGDRGQRNRKENLEEEKRERRNKGEETKTKNYPKSLEDYMKDRVFVFVHHFSGPRDPLGETLRNEAIGKLKVKIISVDKEKTGEDLGDDKPYEDHLRLAREGYVDGFHSGFPCATYSRLRWRKVEGLPGPVRSKQHPYGLVNNTPRQQKECDMGTVLAARSTKMASTVIRSRKTKVRPFATIENPPPSELPDHLSAWELPEVAEFMGMEGVYSSDFHTCAFEPHLEAGRRHYKPQRLAGNLYGLNVYNAQQCRCGEGVKHEPIVGPEKSKQSAEYPHLMCKLYATLAIQHWERMAKEEYYQQKMERLQGEIDERKAEGERKRKRGEEGSQEEEENKIKLTPAPSSSWRGDPSSRHGLLKATKAKQEETEQEVYVGGMRNPAVVVKGIPTMVNFGVRMRAAWESFAKKNPEALRVAEDYGTLQCRYNEEVLREWKAKLKMTLGARSAPTERKHENVPYRSPLDPELLAAWAERAGDPEKDVVRWVREGAPLGMSLEIPTCGIFPPALDGDRGEAEGWMDTDQQLQGGSVVNYRSVQENMDDAVVELDRYRERGYVKDLDEAQLKAEFSGGTISRMGLIVKPKEGGGVKRRFIVDLRRSTGNSKARLPERLILPRPLDAVNTLKSLVEKGTGKMEEERDMELVLVDISDAFMTLAVHREEWKHCVAPSLEEGNYVIFVALLFGFKTAPLLWSRVAAMMSRLLQSAMDPSEAQHQNYLDDGLWAMQGTLTRRNELIAYVLYTLKALGLEVSLKKGQRSSSVIWIGVKYTLLANHNLAMTLPEKFMAEVLQELQAWDKRGMIPLGTLRKMCGRISWLAGILPRARWAVRVLYGSLHDRLHEVESGLEAVRAANREDKRDKSGMIHTSRFEGVRKWLVKFLEASKGNPTRRIQLHGARDVHVRVITDACPEGLGAILVINGVTIAALTSKVSKEDAYMLDFELGQSSSQAIVEALALLVALRHWKKELFGKSITLEFVSDNIAALTLAHKQSGKGAGLNFLGGELSVTMETLAIDRILTTHIPGIASKAADWLSRPSTWENKEMPDELIEIPIKAADPRPKEWYHLEPPGSAPELWGSTVHTHGAWESLRGL